MPARAERDGTHHRYGDHRAAGHCIDGACEVAGPVGSEVVAEWDAVRIVGIVLNSPRQNRLRPGESTTILLVGTVPWGPNATPAYFSCS